MQIKFFFDGKLIYETEYTEKIFYILDNITSTVQMHNTKYVIKYTDSFVYVVDKDEVHVALEYKAKED